MSILADPRRVLTIAQHSRLDRLDRETPDAHVIGWDDRASGPLVRRPGRRVVVVKPDGRLVARIARGQG